MSPHRKAMAQSQRIRHGSVRPAEPTGRAAIRAVPGKGAEQALKIRLSKVWLECRRLTEILADRANAAAKPKGAKRYFYLGMALLAAFTVQAAGQLHWPWLAALQGEDVYRQLSGFALLAFIAHQWHCSVLRSRGLMRKAGGMIKRHKLLGALAPLLFYLHSQQIGYAYLQMLSLAYFAIVLTGLLNFEVVRIRPPWFQPCWITLHVGLSTTLLLLMGYHVFIAYAYR